MTTDQIATDGGERLPKTPREQFAMIPRSVIFSDLGDGPFRTYCAMVYLQSQDEAKDYHAFGQNHLAGMLGKQSETVGKHAVELECRRIIKIDPRENGKTQYWVKHNPSWVDKPEGGRQTHVVDDVVLNQPPLRHHPTKKKAKEVGAQVPEQVGEHRAAVNAKERAARGIPPNGIPAGADMRPDEQDTLSRSTGHPVPTNGSSDSRSAGCLLHLDHGYEGVGLTTTSSDAEKLSTESGTVDTETGEICAAEGHGVIADAEMVIAVAAARDALCVTDDSSTQAAAARPTIGVIKRLTDQVRQMGAQLELTQAQLFQCVDITLDEREPTAGPTTTLTGLTAEVLQQVLHDLPANADIVAAPIPDPGGATTMDRDPVLVAPMPRR